MHETFVNDTEHKKKHDLIIFSLDWQQCLR